MQLRNNIGSVIRRMERLQAGLPEAIGKAIAPSYWKGRLAHVAQVTIRAQWALERNVQTRALYARVTDRILQSLTAETFAPLGSRYELSLQLLTEGQLAEGLDVAAAAEYNLGSRTPTGRKQMYAISEPSQVQNLEASQQAILDWVRLEKRRTEQDTGLTDEQIAQRIQEIIGVSDRAVPRERSDVMQEAAAGLVQAIQGWLAGEGESPPTQPGQGLPQRPTMEPAVVESWLRAVLLAWRAYVQTHLRDRVELELSKLHRRIATELL